MKKPTVADIKAFSMILDFLQVGGVLTFPLLTFIEKLGMSERELSLKLAKKGRKDLIQEFIVKGRLD